MDLVDFLAVTFLRTNEPGVYRLLRRHRAELTGTSIDRVARRSTQPGERAELWHARLSTAGVASVKQLRRMSRILDRISEEEPLG